MYSIRILKFVADSSACDPGGTDAAISGQLLEEAVDLGGNILVHRVAKGGRAGGARGRRRGGAGCSGGKLALALQHNRSIEIVGEPADNRFGLSLLPRQDMRGLDELVAVRDLKKSTFGEGPWRMGRNARL